MSSRRDTIRRIADAVSGIYDRREAEAMARIVVADREAIPAAQLLVFGDEPCRIPEAEYDRLAAELAEGRPVQYVLGHCEFCGLDFEVGEGVLIPRPETEELVAEVCRRAGRGSRILDLCTGSGCIAAALAAKVEGAQVTAVDISERALLYARRNAERAGVGVEFIEADVLGKLGELHGRSFDIIVANPPYIPLSDRASMHINVCRYEPHEALFVADERPLIFYEAIAGAALRLLERGGSLCFEIYELFAAPVCEMLAQRGFTDIAAIEDINSKPRIVCCRR